jgi:hypothetical protein
MRGQRSFGSVVPGLAPVVLHRIAALGLGHIPGRRFDP